MTTRLIIYDKDKKDISDDCSLQNGKSNPFGWSQYEVHYQGKRIGWIESGYPMDFEEGFTFETKEENPELLDEEVRE